MKRLLTAVSLCVLLVSQLWGALPYAGHDSDTGVSRVDGLVDTYTGNLAFTTKDLVVAGAVGRYGLTWSRHATSRSAREDYYFGRGHNWTHAWQWTLSDAGRDDQGRAVLVLREPRGWVSRYTETAPGEWKTAPSIGHQLRSQDNGFTLLMSNGCEVRFTRATSPGEAAFLADEIRDIDGNTWRLGYRDGLLIRVTEPAGRWLQIDYQTLRASGGTDVTVISQVTASDGQVVSYDYAFLAGAAYPVLTGVRYPDAVQASYTYAAPRAGDRLLLVQADDPHADVAIRGKTFRYRTEPEAAWGQLHQIRTIENDALFYALEADPAQKDARGYQVTRENGATVYQTFNPGGNLAQEIDDQGFLTKTDYDANGRGLKIAETDQLGRVTRFEHDARGFLTHLTHADGATKQWQRDARGRPLVETDELGQTRRHVYDAQGRRTRVEHPDGSTEEMSYNAFGQVTSRRDRAGAITTATYDARGLLQQTSDALGGVSQRTYDTKDRLIATTDVQGNTTRYQRDAAGRITGTTFADGATNAVEYDRFGQPVHTRDAVGLEHRMSYDGLGRRLTITGPQGRTTRMEYAPIGTAAPAGRPVKAVAPSGRTTALAYDVKGRPIARTIAAGTADSATLRVAYDPTGRVVSSTNPAGKTVQFAYDQRGRRTKTVSALNRVTATEYDAAGRKIAETDAKGNTTRWTYDAMGRELTRTDAKGQVTRREYDAAGRLVALTDAKGSTYRYEYNLLGRPTALVYPDGSRETTEYNAAGLKTRFTNRAGLVQTFTYDNRNREIRSEWSDGSQTIVKTYDAAGRLTTEDNGVSRLTYVYDESGCLASETQDISAVVSDGTTDPVARVVRSTYDADGRRTGLAYPDGSTVGYGRDEQGRLTTVTENSTGVTLASYTYDAASNATLMPRGNATETAREFDADNNLVSITDRAPNRRGTLSQVDYVYDEVGNRTAAVTARDDERGSAEETIDTYRYDETYQVTAATYAARIKGDHVEEPAAQVRFVYDAVGNRVEVDENGTVTRYAVNNLNQYTRIGEFQPTHDRNGNLSGMGRWLYRYDALNRLASATDGITTARFWYDARNRCVARSYSVLEGRRTTTSVTLNYYDNWNLIEERDLAGTQAARYVHGRRIDEIVFLTNRHGAFYPHHDALGNVTMLTNASGRLVERYTYAVTGQVAISDASGRTLTKSAVGNRWMFTGREWLAEIGLYDYRNRVYSAELGRFLQTDPIRFAAADVNIYRYVQNNLVNFIDPTGEEWLRQEGEQYVLGRDGSIIEPGGVVGAFLEDYGPAMHTFAENHDAFVGYMTQEWGLPDFVVNIPSMPIVYVVSVFEEVVNSIGDFFSWVGSWFE